MNLPVRDVLAKRLAGMSRKRKVASIVASLAVHAFLVLLFVLAPMLSAEHQEPPEFVAVQIIPAQMLGSTTPTPPQPRPRESRPEPEPAPAEPEPEPEPAREPEVVAPPVKPTTPEPKPRTSAAASARKVEAQQTPPPGTLSQREGSATGSRLGTSNFGAAVGFDNPDFTYDYYVDRMLARIREHWNRPSLGGRVEAMIGFRILKDGKVVDVKIVSSSGYNSFDLAAMRAVQFASPLPPLPQTFKHDSLGVNLVVR